jgi:hypothetical protein
MTVNPLARMLKIFTAGSRPELEEWAGYLKKWIFRGECPVCHHALDSRHNIAHIASCNFNGPNLENGFIDEVKARNWVAIVKPFDRLTSMDLMACEAVRCPNGFALVVWVEVDQGSGGAQYSIYIERIEDDVVDRLKEYVELVWQEF